MDDVYDMVKHNAEFRKQKAAEYEIGFELPDSVSGGTQGTENCEKNQTEKGSVNT